MDDIQEDQENGQQEVTKRGRGRPKVDMAVERQSVRERLWTPNLRPVATVRDHLPEVYLPDPPKGRAKGTSEYLAWAMECFLELVRQGYNFSEAAERLGYNYKWWASTGDRYPDWAQEARDIAAHEVAMWEYPDMSRVSFSEFVRSYAGFELAEHQEWIAEALEDPLAKLVLILGHPESGKSTLVSLWYVLYRLAQNPDIRIALVSKSTQKAQDLLTRIKRYLTEAHLYDNSERNLIKDFNGWKPEHGDLEWSQDQIFVKHRKSGERDPTIQALGIGKQIYGTRLDLLILDDSLVLDNQVSATQRERLDTWFDAEARSRAQKGQTVVNGTRLFPLDLYGQWKKAWLGHPLFRFVKIPAILDEYTDDERVTWPGYWTLDGFEVTEEHNEQTIVTGYQQGMRDIREYIVAKDPNRWKLVYQQEDVEDTMSIFRKEHVDLAMDLGAERKMGQVFPHEKLILGVDPATTGRAAAVVLAVDPETKVRTVVDIFVGSQLGATGIRHRLFYQFWERYLSMDHPIDYTVLEVNFAPTLMGDEAFLARAEAAGTLVREHKTTGKGHKRGAKWDEEYGVAALASLFGGGLIAFASATPADRKRLEPLVDDMLAFPWASEQDALIALWVAEGYAKAPSVFETMTSTYGPQRGVPPIIANRRR